MLTVLVRAWPLFDLQLVTSRLRLRALRDDDLDAVVDAAVSGIHGSDVQPFGDRWNGGTWAEVADGLARHHWRTRAELRPESWVLQFTVHAGDRIIGMQSLKSQDFPATRSVRTSSWLRRDAQGMGFGIEMRAAVLRFAMETLGATAAESSFYAGHAPASLAISRRSGYIEERRTHVVVQGEEFDEVHMRLDADAFAGASWPLEVHGGGAARAQLGL